MEPMELDEDSTGQTPPVALPPTHTHRLTYFGSSSASSSSPLLAHSASGMLPGFSPAKTLSSSTPQRSAAAFYIGQQTPFLRSATFPSWQNNSFASPVPTQRIVSRGATPSQVAVDSPGGLGMMTPHRASFTSMENSEPRDVSDMEVVQSSPSPSPAWDRVRSALSSFSLFKNEPEFEQSSVMPGSVSEREGLQEEKEMVKETDTYGKSWEPTLSAVQAAVTFKQGKGRKSSPSKLTETGAQCLDSAPSEKKPHDEETETNVIKSAQTTKQVAATTVKTSKEKSRCCSCGICVRMLSIFLLLVAVVCAFFLQRHVGIQRETFARIDTQLLGNEMASKVFGQHIAVEVVPKSIEQYLSALHARKDRENKDCFIPPLVLSFHGWTGVGKNFVSDTITGLFSVKTVTKLLIPYHFPHQHLDQLYQSQMQQWIVSNVTDYSVNFFILDEMDKATPGVTQGIHNALTKLHQENSCRSPVVFLFLSNSFGNAINQRVFQAMLEEKDRISLSISDFSPLFEDSSNTDTWYTHLQSDITVTVPFLPLEKHHIVQCIRRDLVYKKLSTHADLVTRVLKELRFTRLPSGQEFSQTGCKRVSDKVNLVAFN